MQTPRDRSAGHEASLSYHQRLLADPHRVDAYERAIRALVRPGDVVLDVGAGTGLLSVLAARRGARVHAVESMAVAEALALVLRVNGVADRVTIHRADIRDLPVVEPVDLVVSDFMGRFVVDDHMLEAMASARRWLAPDGRVCPARVTMKVAPVALGHLPALDTFVAPIAGVDVGPLGAQAMRAAYGVEVPRHGLLADPVDFSVLEPARGVEVFDRALAFTVTRADRLRGLVGWFEAELAPGVSLSTEPGVQTHWSQLLLPLPALAVAAGDRVEARLWLETRGGLYVWRWEGEVHRAGVAPVPFSLASERAAGAGSNGARSRAGSDPAAATARLSPEVAPDAVIDAAIDEGVAAFERGDFEAAVRAFERAVRALGPAHDGMAPGVFEDLGLAYVHAGRWVPAVGAFLRALDGDLGAREQSARFLVDACFRGGRAVDGQRYLHSYERHFGAHPHGWRPARR